jgi:hypothetical protein
MDLVLRLRVGCARPVWSGGAQHCYPPAMRSMIAISSSRATRAPDSDVSAANATHSLLESSITRSDAGSMASTERGTGGHRRRRQTRSRGSNAGSALVVPSSARASPKPALRRASPLFCGDVFQHRDIQHRFREQPLQLGVLILQRPKSLGLGHL